jgi:hypothetical protein
VRRLSPMLERELPELPASGAEAVAYIGSVREILARGDLRALVASTIIGAWAATAR